MTLTRTAFTASLGENKVCFPPEDGSLRPEQAHENNGPGGYSIMPLWRRGTFSKAVPIWKNCVRKPEVQLLPSTTHCRVPQMSCAILCSLSMHQDKEYKMAMRKRKALNKKNNEKWPICQEMRFLTCLSLSSWDNRIASLLRPLHIITTPLPNTALCTDSTGLPCDPNSPLLRLYCTRPDRFMFSSRSHCDSTATVPRLQVVIQDVMRERSAFMLPV